MSTRTYTCNIIGAGTDDDPFRPAVADYAVSWSARIDTGLDGTPTSATCVAEVTTDDHSVFTADTSIVPIDERLP